MAPETAPFDDLRHRMEAEMLRDDFHPLGDAAWAVILPVLEKVHAERDALEATVERVKVTLSATRSAAELGRRQQVILADDVRCALDGEPTNTASAKEQS